MRLAGNAPGRYGKMRVLFAEGLFEIIPERFDQIVHRALFGCEDESLGGHTGNKRGSFGELAEFAFLESYLGAVIGSPRGVIGESIGRDPDHLAEKLGGAALIKGGKAQVDALACVDFIDMDCRNLCCDNKRAVLWNDVKHGLGCANNGAGRIDGEAIDDA